MLQEFVIYDKTENYGDYEDRGYKGRAILFY